MRRKEEGEEAMDDERAMEVGPRIAAARRKEGLAVRWDENVTMHIYVEMYLNSRLSGEFRAVI